jgi:hypothetical protein
MNKRLLSALVCYAMLAAAAFFLLHGIVLRAVLILYAGLLAKTLIAWKAGW